MNQHSDNHLSARGRRAVLAVMCIALMMVVAAVASLNVALPDLARSTGASQSQLQWIVDAYALVFAGLLLPAGALGDRYGRKGILQIGLAVFGIASLAAIFVNDPGWLIGLRAVIGVGAALVMPTTLSIITNVFPEDERGRAVGIWAGVAGAGAVVGLLLSGALLEWFSWSSVFAINVTLAVLASAGTARVVPTSRGGGRTGLDPVGAVLSSIGLFGLIAGIIEAPIRGWLDGYVLSGFVAGAVLLVAFVLYELHRREPMLDPRLFARRGFAAGSLSLTLQFFAQFGLLFVGLQYLQLVLGYSPIEAGASILPMALMVVLIAPRAPRIAERLGVRVVGAAGLATMGAGFLIFASLGAALELLAVRPGGARDRDRDRTGDGPGDDGDRLVPAGGAAGDRLGGERPHPRGGRGVRDRGAREHPEQRLPRQCRAGGGAPAGSSGERRTRLGRRGERRGRAGRRPRPRPARARADGVRERLLYGPARRGARPLRRRHRGRRRRPAPRTGRPGAPSPARAGGDDGVGCRG